MAANPYNVRAAAALAEKTIAAAASQHSSLPGLGPLLGGRISGRNGRRHHGLPSGRLPGRLRRLAPSPRGSGQVSGKLLRPRRYNHALNQVFYISALISIQHDSEPKAFYERERYEGKRSTQTVLALTRRRVNVLWAPDQRRTPVLAPSTRRRLMASRLQSRMTLVRSFP
jgi:Transposase IS116/IS110/IS902 family